MKIQPENGEKCCLSCWISVNVMLLLLHLYMGNSYPEASQPSHGYEQRSGVTQALLEVCTEKQDHPGRISSHLLFLLFPINREAESFETPYENRKVNAWIPCSSPAGCMMLQGGTSWCRRSLPAPAAAMLKYHSWISRAQKLAFWGGSSLRNLSQ